MRSISSLTYTNVSLTVLILLLLALVVKPLVSLPTAHAADDLDTNPDQARNEAQSRRIADLNPNADNAAATREVAEAIREVAAALNKSAAAQANLATSFGKLGQDAVK